MLDKFLPPTDNLYKFIAISGLMLIGFSFVPHYFRFRLIEQAIDIDKKINILTIENNDIGRKNDNRIKKLKEGTSNQAETEKMADETAKDFEKQKELEIGFAEIKSTQNILALYNNQISTILLISYVITSLGVVFVIVGFRLWYVKIQKPSDLLLMNEAREQKLTKPTSNKRES